jgi:hypothetical protein
MGLLDDAIREHLELKRLRGADPSEVARDERAALGPPDDAVADEASPIDYEEEELDPDEEPSDADGVGGADGETAPSPDAAPPRSSEETMEVDMRTIIDAEADDSDLELRGEAMSTSAVPSRATVAERAAGGAEGDSDAADAEASGKRRWRTSRPARALGLGGSPSADGSVS